jgi:hypothetical protein
LEFIPTWFLVISVTLAYKELKLSQPAEPNCVHIVISVGQINSQSLVFMIGKEEK